MNGTSAIRISGASGIIDFRNGAGKLLAPDGSSLAFLFGSVYSVGFANNRLGVSASSSIGWTSGNFAYAAGQDLRLFRDAANTLAQRNDTNAQAYRLYNTWGNNGVDFERLSFNWDTNVFKITSEAGGTGTVRGIQLGSAATEPVALFGATPVVQPTTAVGSATVAGGGGTAVNDATTFNGYTLAQVVQALQNLGILA